MSNQRDLHPAIEKYLNELEVAAKQRLGVCPNQILRDAEEHLVRDFGALQRVEPELNEVTLLEHFRQSFGEPDAVAKSYEQFSETTPSMIPALAPHWRIHCTKCGLSAPAQKVGITRIGARSVGKRVLGWCRGCNRFRFLSVTRDLNCSGTISPAEQLTKNTPTKDANKMISRKISFIGWLLIVAITLSGIVIVGPQLSSIIQAAQKKAASSKAPGLTNQPAGWEIASEIEVKGSQLDQFSKKLGIPLKSMFNTVVRFENRNLQINTVTAQNETDAERLKETLRMGKPNPRWVVRNETSVYELVVRSTDNARVAAKALYAFPIQAARRTYEVAFEAIPIQSEENSVAPDTRNRLFNLFLAAPTKPALASEIELLSKGFTFSKDVSLVHNLQGHVIADWKANNAKVSTQAGSESTRVEIANVNMKFGMPVQSLTATLTIDSNQKRKVDPKFDKSALLAANSRFPTESTELQQLVRSLTAPTDSESVRLQKLLNWFADPVNIKYDGLTGSRYGTNVVIKQRFGRCWDYSDLFITLARIAGLPSRQVYGWVHESEGHVWCDVIVDGNWQMVDPTSGTIVGSDYLPFCVSNVGEFPLIYASKVSINVK